MDKGTLKDPRRVLPRWRSIEKTPKVELKSSRRGDTPPSLQDSVYDAALREWRESKSLEAAAELATSSAVFGTRAEAIPALRAIISDQSDAVAPLQDQVRRTLSRDTVNAAFEPAPPGTIAQEIEEIRALKKRIRAYPRDGLAELEMARRKVNIGQVDSAKKHVDAATKLCPSNRYIVRSAARYFVHVRDEERALNIIERSELLSGDPWVQSAEVAVSAIAGRTPKCASKQIRRLKTVNSIREDYSELAAGLGALELEAGATKRAKRLFEKSMTSPNENALAQLRWAQANGTTAFASVKPAKKVTDYCYEADVYSLLLHSKISDATVAAMEWFDDEPYSVRPAVMGSSLCLGVLGDASRAMEFIDRGLASNRDARSLINNKIVALARSGDTKQAREILEQNRSWLNDIHARPFYHAADGLISFRTRQLVNGSTAYAHAYDAALECDPELALMSLAYWLEEEAYSGIATRDHILKCVHLIDEKFEKMSKKGSNRKIYWAAIRARILSFHSAVNIGSSDPISDDINILNVAY